MLKQSANSVSFYHVNYWWLHLITNSQQFEGTILLYLDVIIETCIDVTCCHFKSFVRKNCHLNGLSLSTSVLIITFMQPTVNKEILLSLPFFDGFFRNSRIFRNYYSNYFFIKKIKTEWHNWIFFRDEFLNILFQRNFSFIWRLRISIKHMPADFLKKSSISLVQDVSSFIIKTIFAELWNILIINMIHEVFLRNMSKEEQGYYNSMGVSFKFFEIQVGDSFLIAGLKQQTTFILSLESFTIDSASS